jgi:hypothetical protein
MKERDHLKNLHVDGEYKNLSYKNIIERGMTLSGSG